MATSDCLYKYVATIYLELSIDLLSGRESRVQKLFYGSLWRSMIHTITLTRSTLQRTSHLILSLVTNSSRLLDFSGTKRYSQGNIYGFIILSLSLSLTLSLSLIYIAFFVARTTLPLIQNTRQCIRTWHNHSPTTSSTPPTTPTWRGTSWMESLPLRPTLVFCSRAVAVSKSTAGMTVSAARHTHMYSHT